ncbi:hypothetical protein B1757_10290 [Acidithiobacillus marinus]|uniref:Uncharacterized protein n=1 Tax=Acidithiobacillus marinus TaxID=187490 RepID=A0A2I1DKA6_9PROT|nr:FtsX-like permease family protein [Acidithiobacillus marinus]PKY10310.1 hypothetical protein B1757_10290 [Acidithiobacillus marinus]
MNNHSSVLSDWANRLWRDRSYTVVSGIFLGLSIAMATLGFTVFYTFFFKPLPYPEANRIVVIRQILPVYGLTGYLSRSALLSPLRRATHAELQDSALVSSNPKVTISLVQGQRLAVHYQSVTPNFFPMLLRHPYLGRWPSAAAGHRDGPQEAMLSFGFWSKAFGKKASAVGSEISLHGKVYQVVGVLPQNFTLHGLAADVYVPLVLPQDKVEAHYFDKLTFAQLGADHTLESLRPVLSTLAEKEVRRIPARFRNQGKGYRLLASPLRNYVLHKAHMAQLPWLYLGGGLFVWLIAVLNIINYAVLRHQRRLRGFAIRQLLGASRGAVIQIFLSEQLPALLLSLFLAIPLTFLGIRWLSSTIFSGSAYADFPLRFTGWEGLFLLVLLLVSAVCVVAIPLWRLRPSALKTALTHDERTASLSKPLRRMFQALNTLQAALAIGLLSTALSLAIGNYVLSHRSLGFQPKNVEYSRVYLPTAANITPDWLQIESNLRRDPYVRSSAFALFLPWDSSSDGAAGASSSKRSGKVLFDIVSPGFFRLLDIPLQRGQAMPALNDQESPSIWVDTDFCRSFFSSEQCVGQPVIHPDQHVAGVVPSIAWKLMPNRGYLGVEYFPLNSTFDQLLGGFLSSGYILLRIPVQSASALRSASQYLHLALPSAVFSPLHSYTALIHKTQQSGLNFDLLFGIFAFLATGITLFGVYVVQATTQAARLPEYRIRSMLGAENRDFYRGLLRDLFWVILPGAFVGTAVALLLVHLAAQDFPDAMRFLPISLLLTFFLVLFSIGLSYFNVMRSLLRLLRSDPSNGR